MAGSTNFQQFNPTQSNQETDAAFTADALRSGGVQVNNPLPSPLLNKLWYQLSTFVTAFANMLVSKGYSPMDTSEAALAAVLANVLTNADTQPNILVVAYSPTAVFDRSKGIVFQMSLTGNVTAPTLINVQPGQFVTFILITDGTAGHSFTFPSQVITPGDLSSMAANTNYIQQFVCLTNGFCLPVTALTQYP
jgi:hypothetical protein